MALKCLSSKILRGVLLLHPSRLESSSIGILTSPKRHLGVAGISTGVAFQDTKLLTTLWQGLLLHGSEASVNLTWRCFRLWEELGSFELFFCEEIFDVFRAKKKLAREGEANINSFWCPNNCIQLRK